MVTPLYCCNDYKVDSDGFIISKRDKKPMKPSVSPHGYLTTTVMINGKRKTMPIHSAVAKSFLGDKTIEGMVVNHKDGNKQNNNLSNLEWVTPKDNTLHSIYTLGNGIGSSNSNARKICGIDKITGEVKYSYDSIIDCAKALCNNNGKERMVQNGIWKALTGNRKTYKGHIWKYVD
jgi:hypothetical protein